MISYITQNTPCKGCYRISMASAFSRGGGKNHRNTLRADAYCFEIRAHIRLQKYPDARKSSISPLQMAWYDEVTTWWPLKLDRLAKDSSHCFLACVAQISVRKTDNKQRRRRKREGLKKQCCSLYVVHFFAVTERLRSQNAVFQSFTADVNKWQRTFLSLFKLRLSSSEFISRSLRLYLTKSAKAWNNRDNGSKNAKFSTFLSDVFVAVAILLS